MRKSDACILWASVSGPERYVFGSLFGRLPAFCVSAGSTSRLWVLCESFFMYLFCFCFVFYSPSPSHTNKLKSCQFLTQLLSIFFFLFVVSALICLIIYIGFRSIQIIYRSLFCSHSFWRPSTSKNSFFALQRQIKRWISQSHLTLEWWSDAAYVTHQGWCGWHRSRTVIINHMDSDGPMRVYNGDRQSTSS